MPRGIKEDYHPSMPKRNLQYLIIDLKVILKNMIIKNFQYKRFIGPRDGEWKKKTLLSISLTLKGKKGTKNRKQTIQRDSKYMYIN